MFSGDEFYDDEITSGALDYYVELFGIDDEGHWEWEREDDDE